MSFPPVLNRPARTWAGARGNGIAVVPKGRRVRLQMRDLLEAYPELCCEAIRQLPPCGGPPARCEAEWTRTIQHEGRTRKVCRLHEHVHKTGRVYFA